MGLYNSCTSAHLCVYISPLSSKTSVNRIGCYLFTSNQLFFQEGIKLLFQWTKFGELFTPYLMVDDDVEWFVLELTKNLWLYVYHTIRRLLFSIDKGMDIMVSPIVIYYLAWRWRAYVRLGIYIVLRLISFALHSNTLQCKCYAVRTVISTVISSLFCAAAFAIATTPDTAKFPSFGAFMILFCTMHISTLLCMLLKTEVCG